jgi:amino acid transporter
LALVHERAECNPILAFIPHAGLTEDCQKSLWTKKRALSSQDISKPMNSTSLLYHISSFLVLALPIASVLWFILAGKRKVSSLFLHAVLAAIACYILLVFVCVPATDAHLKQKAESTVQGTPEHTKAWEEFGNDTGRTFSIFTGIILCPLYSGFWHLLIGAPYLLITRKKQSPASD